MERMALQSMTGFARHAVQHTVDGGDVRIVWEVRSVNGKGLDLRLRLPQGMEAAEHPVRTMLARHFSRGNFQASLSVERSEAQAGFTINQVMLAEVLKLGADLQARHGLAPASVDGILSLRGIIDQVQVADNEDERGVLEAVIVSSFEEALKAIAEARKQEGEALFAILSAHVDTIERLTESARRDPSRNTAPSEHALPARWHCCWMLRVNWMKRGSIRKRRFWRQRPIFRKNWIGSRRMWRPHASFWLMAALSDASSTFFHRNLIVKQIHCVPNRTRRRSQPSVWS